MTLQEIIDTLAHYWADRGCLLHQPWDAEVGAGTMHPETFLRVLGPAALAGRLRAAVAAARGRPLRREPEPRSTSTTSSRSSSSRAPADVQDLYLQSLAALGIDPRAHDVRFEEDNWESPTLGAWGIGWQVLLDGQEITQFTYFQQAGGIDLAPISAEITYGLERIAMYLQDVDNMFDVEWAEGRVVRARAAGGGVPALALLVRARRAPSCTADLFDRYMTEGWRRPERAGRAQRCSPPTTAR